MAKSEKSCVGRLLRGCGCLALLSLLLAAGIGVFTLLSQPEPAELDITLRQDRLPAGDTEILQIGTRSSAAMQPIRVVLEMRLVDLAVVADAEPGQFKVDGRYDRANFDLETNLSRVSNGWLYRLDFEPKHRMLIHVDDEETQNHLTLHLPHSTPLDMDLNLRLAEAEIDLTGVALAGLAIDLSLGKLMLRMGEPNPIDLPRFDLAASMANLEILDVQNFGFQRGKVSITMGEARVYNSGPLIRDTDIGFKVTMAQLYLQVPEKTRLTVHEDSFLGGYEGPRLISSAPDAPRLDLRGSVKMGGIEVETATTKPSAALVLKGILLREDATAATRRYHELKARHPNRFHFHPGGLQSLARYLRQSGRMEDARIILELSIQEFPGSAESYLMLAELYGENGDLDHALETLQNALALQPGNLEIQKKLQRLGKKRAEH